MKRCSRPIESDLPAIPAEVPPDDRELWRDSSLDLERGLDVIELPFDIPIVQEQDLASQLPGRSTGRR